MSKFKSLEEVGSEMIGPFAYSEVETIPGIFKRVEQFSDGLLSNMHPTLLASIVPSSELADLYIETKLLWSEEFYYKVLDGGGDYVEYHSKGALSRLRDRFQGIQIQESWEEEGHVVFTELHCPKIKKCQAHYSHKTINSKDYFVQISIFGYGGGSGISVKSGTGHRIPAIEECLQILIPIKARVEKCSSFRGEFHRVTILDAKLKEFPVREIPPEHDRCYLPLAELDNPLWEKEAIEARYPTTPRKYTKDEDVGKAFSLKLPVSLGFLNFNLKVSTQILKTCKYEYELFGPQTYNCYRLPETQGVCWSW
ncbi:MAG: hypothetical protein ACXAEU_26045 [Candidatus Hodarchaeales archaeon]|jgi:hypothetical protein